MSQHPNDQFLKLNHASKLLPSHCILLKNMIIFGDFLTYLGRKLGLCKCGIFECNSDVVNLHEAQIYLVVFAAVTTRGHLLQENSVNCCADSHLVLF